MDQRSLLEHKRDIAVFQSTPMREDVTVVGNIRAELFFSTDAADVDLYVKVQDVAADGTAYALMDAGAEVLRASLREVESGTTSQPGRLEPGKVYRLDLGTLLTANTFHKGDRIRVILCGSWYPGMTRNLQTGASEATTKDMRPARITLHHSQEFPSRLIFPVATAAPLSPVPPIPGTPAPKDQP
jgi:hypothetical protein